MVIFFLSAWPVAEKQKEVLVTFDYSCQASVDKSDRTSTRFLRKKEDSVGAFQK